MVNDVQTKIRLISKMFLLFVICIVVGLLLSIRTRTLTLAQNAQVVPLGDPITELQTAQQVMYKVVSWKSDYYQGCTDIIQNPRSLTKDSDYTCRVRNEKMQRWDSAPPNVPCNHCGEYPRSKSSFVDVALREGLTNEDIFNTCSFPTRTRVMKRGGSRDETVTFALPISMVEREISDCVIEMLINMLTRDNWSLLPRPSADTLYFSRSGNL